MLAILVLISAASHMYNLNGIKSKTVGDGQHGAARRAIQDLVKAGLIRKEHAYRRNGSFTSNRYYLL